MLQILSHAMVESVSVFYYWRSNLVLLVNALEVATGRSASYFNGITPRRVGSCKRAKSAIYSRQLLKAIGKVDGRTS
jgi:hypothetical protein